MQFIDWSGKRGPTVCGKPDLPKFSCPELILLIPIKISTVNSITKR